jgi:hypothetical protein
MKKVYSLLFLAFSVFTGKAQLTQANHAPSATDTYTNNQCDSTNITFGSGGANAVWNYSAVPVRTNITISYAGSSNPTTSAFPNADVKITSSLANDTYHYKSTANDLSFYGGGISLSTAVAILNYSTPAIFAQYPMSLNSTNTNTVAGTFSITSPLTVPGTFTGSCTYSVDGTGTLTLSGPSNSYTNVMRVVTTQTMELVTSLTTGTLTQKSYNYYSSGIKAPIFTINTGTLNIPLFGNFSETMVYINKAAVKTATTAPPTQTYVTVAENASQSITIQLYPNPASSIVNLVTENAPSANLVSVFDITGKLVEKQFLIEGKVKFNTSDYQSGLYIYSISSKTGETLKTGKFTVSH